MTLDAHWFIRARLKTRQLLLLQALEDEGNIHRAAQTLNLTQPAASKLLKELEDMLGVPLFDRLPRGMRPTRYGDARESSTCWWRGCSSATTRPGCATKR